MEAAEALKARTEEAAERAKEGLKGAAGTARMGAQRVPGTAQGAAQQAKESAAEGARTAKQTVAQDTERVTGVYRDQTQEPHPEAQQAPTRVRSHAARLCLSLQYAMAFMNTTVIYSGGTLMAHIVGRNSLQRERCAERIERSDDYQ